MVWFYAANTFKHIYQYIDTKKKWLAAVNLLEPGEIFVE